MLQLVFYFFSRFVNKMNDAYSIMLLHQHVCCLFGICFGIFLMTKDGLLGFNLKYDLT